MSNIATINKLQKILNDLYSITSVLNQDIVELKKVLENDQFIPVFLNNKICDALVQIANSQEELKQEYLLLNIGMFPKKKMRLNNLWKNIEKNLKRKVLCVSFLHFVQRKKKLRLN